ncbi:hypothetical protein [Azospirillum endophyticum]
MRLIFGPRLEHGPDRRYYRPSPYRPPFCELFFLKVGSQDMDQG